MFGNNAGPQGLPEKLNSFMVDFEDKIPSEAFILVPPVMQKDEQPEVKELNELINLGVNLVNRHYKESVLSIYLEISDLFKQARTLAREIYKDKNSNPINRELLRKTFADIGTKKEELKKLRQALQAKDLNHCFAIMNAKQLVIFNSVVSMVLTVLKQNQGKHYLNGHITILSEIQKLIINRMMALLRQEADRPKQTTNLGRSVTGNMIGSFIAFEDHNDKTFLDAMPPLPDAANFYGYIPEYFVATVYDYHGGDEKIPDVAYLKEKFSNEIEKHEAKEKNTLLATAINYTNYYLNPENNAYTGLVMDGAVGLWEKIGKNIWNGFISFLDNFRGNFIAVAINEAMDTLANNKNYQKICQQWSDHYKAGKEFANNLKQSFSSHRVKKPEKKELDVTVFDKSAEEMAKSNAEIKALLEEFEIEENYIKDCWAEMANDWVVLTPEEMKAEQKPEPVNTNEPAPAQQEVKVELVNIPEQDDEAKKPKEAPKVKEGKEEINPPLSLDDLKQQVETLKQEKLDLTTKLTRLEQEENKRQAKITERQTKKQKIESLIDKSPHMITVMMMHRYLIDLLDAYIAERTGFKASVYKFLGIFNRDLTNHRVAEATRLKTNLDTSMQKLHQYLLDLKHGRLKNADLNKDFDEQFYGPIVTLIQAAQRQDHQYASGEKINKGTKESLGKSKLNQFFNKAQNSFNDMNKSDYLIKKEYLRDYQGFKKPY